MLEQGGAWEPRISCPERKVQSLQNTDAPKPCRNAAAAGGKGEDTQGCGVPYGQGGCPSVTDGPNPSCLLMRLSLVSPPGQA